MKDKNCIWKFPCCFQAIAQSCCGSVGLLILRLIAGLAFVLHGWGKIQTPMSWLPEGAPVQIPGIFQALAAISEFGGGIAWMLGLLTPLASLGLAITMAVAVYFHAIVNGDPFVSATGGMAYEAAAGYFAVAIALLSVGPGKFSLDRLIFGERPACGLSCDEPKKKK